MAEARLSPEKSKKRLLAVYPFTPYPPNFGARIRCFELLKLLREHFEVEVAALMSHEDDPAMLERLKSKVKGVFGVPAPRALRLTGRAKLRNILSPVPWEVPIASPEMERLVGERSRGYDVLFLFSARLLHLRSFSRSPVNVLDLDDIAHVVLYRRLRQMDGIKARLGYSIELVKTLFYEIKRLAGFDLALTASALDLSRLARWNRKLPLRVVPNGVDLTAFSSIGPRGSGGAALLFVGALDFRPNVVAARWLMKGIFPRIKARMENANLMMVGRNPTEEVLSWRGDGVEVFGDVPDVRPYLESSDVVVTPLTIGGGTRIKILEAAAAGRPVVSTTLGAEGLGFVPGKEIELADREDEFVAKTLGLLSDRDRAQRIARAARHKVEREFSWDESRRRLEQALSPWL